MRTRQQLISSIVAAAYCVLAAAGGGYSDEVRAAGTILVWWAVMAGIAFGALPRARVPRRALLAGAGLAALAALSLVSMAWASDDAGALREAVRAAGYLGVFALIVVAAPRGSARAWLGGLAAGLVGVALLALGSRIQPSLFPDQDLNRLIPSVRSRLSYPVNYWNGLAACMAAAVVLLLWLGAHAVTRAGRAAAVAALPLPALALFLTSSRGGVLALAVGLTALLALGPDRGRAIVSGLVGGGAAGVAIVLANARDTFVDGTTGAPQAGSQGHEMLVVIVLACAAAGAVRWALDGPLGRLAVPRAAAAVFTVVAVVGVAGAVLASDPAHRYDAFKDPPAASGPERGFVTRHLASAEGNGRAQFWESGLDAFEAQPLRGIGAGGYESWWAQHGSLAYFIRNSHSLFVEVAAELGLLGLLALLAFLGVTFAGGVAARASMPRGDPAAGAALAVLACGIASAAIDWTWQLPAAFIPVVVAAAVLTGPASATAAGGEEEPARFGLGLATLALGWLVVIGAAIVLLAQVKLDSSRDAARHGDLRAAASDARAAEAVEPWSGAPRLQIALVRERAGELAGARVAIREAIERDTDDWRVWLVATRLATRAGDIPDARRSLRRARILNPRAALFADGSP